MVSDEKKEAMKERRKAADRLMNCLIRLDGKYPLKDAGVIINVRGIGYLSGCPYLFSSSPSNAFVFRDRAQAGRIQRNHWLILQYAEIIDRKGY